MFSSSKKKKQKENSVSLAETRNVSQTSQNLTVQTMYQQRSYSVSYSQEVQQQRGFPTTSSASITSLPGLNLGSNFLPPPANLALQPSSSLTNLRSRTDAKPFTPSININYQSPYRNSPVYRSYGSGNFAGRNTVASQTPPLSAPPVIREPAASAIKPKFTKKLVVKKTGVFYDGDDKGIPTYKTSSKNRGEVLIINNIMFEGEEERKGAKVDHERLEDLFKQMGFSVTSRRDLKGKIMKVEIEKFSQKSSLKTADISIVVVMSHGTKNPLQGGTEVFGIDQQGVLVEDILQYFSGDKCKKMLNKPKIFIFQCCRGDSEQTVLTDARPLANKPRPLADMLIAYSTLPGFVSYRDPNTGTWYIQTICDVFSQHAHEYHVEELLKIVDVELANLSDVTAAQTSSYESRGFKRCYLHPK